VRFWWVVFGCGERRLLLLFAGRGKFRSSIVDVGVWMSARLAHGVNLKLCRDSKFEEER
jgi:hypothetical protein